jgi:arylsulfatase A-like enzyme
LAGVKIPSKLDGKSLVPMMKNPTTRIKEFAVSQYPRTNNKMETERLGYSEGEFMGYSIRTERYRYTIWMKDNFRSSTSFKSNLVVGSELYDYKEDPLETKNVASEKKYSSIIKDMHKKMLSFLRIQVKME